MKSLFANNSHIFVVQLTAIALAVAQFSEARAGEGSSTEATSPTAIYVFLVDTSTSMRVKPTGSASIHWSVPKIDEVKRQLNSVAANLPDNALLVTYRFDDRLVVGPRARIGAAGASESIARFFTGLQADGNLTHLWESIDTVLAHAVALSEQHPGIRVNVYVYTDGEDTQQANKRDPDQVLAKYFSHLKGPVRMSCVTLGFELSTASRQAFERASVRVVPALDPAQIVPVGAAFRLVPDSALVGQSVVLVDESMGFMIKQRRVDWGDGGSPSESRSPSHVYDKPGEYRVRLGVRTADGQQSVAARKLRVELPPSPTANFYMSPTTILAGESVAIVDRSVGDVQRWEWRMGDQTSSDPSPEFCFSSPGEFDVVLTVYDTHGQSSVTTQRLVVNLPAAPIARIEGPNAVEVSQDATFVDMSEGIVSSRAWFVDNVKSGSEKILKCHFGKVGQSVVRLRVEGQGGHSETEMRVTVSSLPPTASFVANARVVYVGDEITMTDTSRGVIDRVEFFVGDRGEPLVVGRVNPGQPGSVSFRAQKAGSLAIRQVVRGPGGENTARSTVTVKCRVTAPIAAFSADRVRGRGSLKVRFENRSTGSVRKSRFDFADGSPPVEVDGKAGASHVFGPGEHHVTLTAVGPDDFEPSVAEVNIAVAKPYPAWTKGIFVLPSALGVAWGCGALWTWKRQRLAALNLTGRLFCQPISDVLLASRSFEFDGSRRECVVDLGAGAQIRIRAVEVANDQVEYWAELTKDGEVTTSRAIRPNYDEQFGSFLLTYSP